MGIVNLVCSKKKGVQEEQCEAIKAQGRPWYQGEREVSFSSFISFICSLRPRSHGEDSIRLVVVPPTRRRPRFYDFQNHMRPRRNSD